MEAGSSFRVLVAAVMKLVRPVALMQASPAAGAAAGPDSSVMAARCETVAGEATPPLDCMISSTPR